MPKFPTNLGQVFVFVNIGVCLREYRLCSCRPALQISVGFVRFGTFILGMESFLTQSGIDRYC